MSKFCGGCGSPLTEGQKFCGKCGAGNSVQQAAARPVEAVPPSAPAAHTQPIVAAAPAPGGSNTLLKVGIAAILIIFVGGAAALGAVFYAVHRVKARPVPTAGSGHCSRKQQPRRVQMGRTGQMGQTPAVSKAIHAAFSARRMFLVPLESRSPVRKHRMAAAAISPGATPRTWSPNT
jgi:hypothetical protein